MASRTGTKTTSIIAYSQAESIIILNIYLEMKNIPDTGLSMSFSSSTLNSNESTDDTTVSTSSSEDYEEIESDKYSHHSLTELENMDQLKLPRI